ncbi:MAG: M28 family peptidase [Acidobacteriota bacterium]
MLPKHIRWRLLAALVPLAAVGADLPSTVRAIGAEVKPEQAMEYMRRIYATERWFTFPKMEETARYLERTMREIGLKDVEVVPAPADGVSQFGYWTMPLAWDVKRARLEMVEPESQVLADYEKVPASLGMWSGPTRPGGVTAEVVELNDDSPAAVEKLDLKGKLVLTSRNPAGIKWLLARRGALGAINTFTENADLKDGRQWINSWGDHGWAFTKGSAPLVSFSITPRQAELLRKLLAARRTVRLKAEVDSRYYTGTYPYVTGVLAGSGSGEEVLTLGHTAEQGAQDNATGVAAMLESLAALNRLIAAGKLPRPARSIRILAMPEMYGTMHYIAANPERIGRTVAAMCLDTPAAFYHLAGTEYTFYLNPHVAKSYTDALVLRVAEAWLARLRPPRPFHWKPYMTGTDTHLSDPTIGIPTVWPYSGSGVHTHHNSEDKPENVDARSLRDLAVMNAAYLYYIAAAGDPEARWLAEITLTRGYEQVLATAAPLLDRLLAAGEERGQLLHQGLEKLAYAVEREEAAVLSVVRLAAPQRREAVRRELAPLVDNLRRFGREQEARLRAGAGGVEPVRSAADPRMAEAARMVVKRKRFGTITLDDLPVDQREGYPSAAWALAPITALNWCDGRRNLAEVIRLTRLELGAGEFDFAGYFRFLARRGYVEITEGPQ